MTFNVNCVRAVLMLVADNLDMSSGRRPKPVKLKSHMEDACLADFSDDEIYTAAKYLLQKKLVSIAAREQSRVLDIAPKFYVFTSVTANGLEYLSVVRDDSTWINLKRKLGNVFEKALPVLFSTAVDFGFNKLGG